MSGGDLIEYFGSDERKQPSDMLNRSHHGLFNAIQQQRIEREVDGIQEGSGVGGRVERRGESQRIMREIAGGPINPALFRGLQEGMINAGRYFGVNLPPQTTLLDGIGKIGEVVNTGLDAVESAYDLLNRGREQIGAGALSDVESVLSGVEQSSIAMPSNDIFEEIQKKMDDIVERTKNPSITSSGHTFWNRITNPNEYSWVDESINVIPRIFAENETPEEKHATDDYPDDSASNLWADLENASAFRGLDRLPGGRRTPSWVDDLDFNGDGRIDRVELAVSKNGNATNDIRLIHPLLAKAHRHPNFLRSKIEQKKIGKETPYNKNTQVNLVQQGEANFMKDFNQFNVNF